MVSLITTEEDAGGPLPGGMANGVIKDVTLASFRADVVEASKDAVVLLDFWAEWCGPCKQLTPLLEKVVPSYQGRVRLAKINIDKEQALAGQFGIQSVPTVMAVVGGRPANYFQGAVPETQLRAFIDKALEALGPIPEAADIEAALSQAAALTTAGDPGMAASIYQAILDAEPGHAQATIALAALLTAVREFDQAATLLDSLDAAKAKTPEVTQLRAAIALAREYAPAPDHSALLAALAQNPNNHDALYALASDAIARGDMDGAAAYLLDSISRKRDYNDGAARQLLLRLFEAGGHDSEFTSNNRRKLSAILFS
jgi:putative thioredoxin